MLTRQPHPLSIEEIEEVAVSCKEELQGSANRYVRQKEVEKAYAALESIEAINKFLYDLKLRAGSQMGQPARARPIRIFRKKE